MADHTPCSIDFPLVEEMLAPVSGGGATKMNFMAPCLVLTFSFVGRKAKDLEAGGYKVVCNLGNATPHGLIGRRIFDWD